VPAHGRRGGTRLEVPGRPLQVAINAAGAGVRGARRQAPAKPWPPRLVPRTADRAALPWCPFAVVVACPFSFPAREPVSYLSPPEAAARIGDGGLWAGSCLLLRAALRARMAVLAKLPPPRGPGPPPHPWTALRLPEPPSTVIGRIAIGPGERLPRSTLVEDLLSKSFQIRGSFRAAKLRQTPGRSG